MDLATFLPTLDARKVRPLRREEYDKLVQAGAFEGERVELLYGVVVRMSPIGPPHGSSVQELNLALVRAVGNRAVVRIQTSFVAGGGSEPEPDAAIVPPGNYWKAHPTAAWLIIEVADSSLADDRKKAALYAASDVEEYWIVNLVDQQIEVHRDRRDGVFTQTTTYGRGSRVTMAHLPDVSISVDDVLPP